MQRRGKVHRLPDGWEQFYWDDELVLVMTEIRTERTGDEIVFRRGIFGTADPPGYNPEPAEG